MLPFLPMELHDMSATLLKQARILILAETAQTALRGLQPEHLTAHRLQPVPPTLPESIGWIPFYTARDEQDERLLQQVQGLLRMDWGIERRLLPADVVRSEVDERLEALRDQGLPSGGRVRKQMIEAVTAELLPQAFIQHKRGRVVIHPDGWLATDLNGDAGDAPISALRDALGGLEAINPTPEHNPSDILTQMVREPTAFPDLTLLDACLLVHEARAAKVAYRGVELDDPTLLQQLNEGFKVSRVRVQVRERTSITLCDDLILRQISPLEDGEFEGAGDDPAAAEDANLLLAGSAVAEVLAVIRPLFGF